jgi:hypothetical protein
MAFPGRHARESGHPEVFEIPGFRVALAIASLPGMTLELGSELQGHPNRYAWKNRTMAI